MTDKSEIVEEGTEVNLDEQTPIVENDTLEIEELTTPKKEKREKKHKEALRLVEQAKKIVKDANDQTDACKLLLVSDLKEYEEAKEAMKKGGLTACASLLEQLGYKTKVDETKVEEVAVFEPKEEIAPIALKNVSSGTFTGVVYALVGGAITATGLVFLATEKLDMTLNIAKIPSTETMGSIASWFSQALGMGANVYVGAGIFALVSLSVMAVIYAMRVRLKGNENLHFSVKQLAEAELYTELKGECKVEMDKVDAHMKETVSTLKMYEVLFNEQKGKLERILHIEGSKDKSTDYHEKSFLEIRETKELMRTIKDFIATSMSEEGKLSKKSVFCLQRAKTQMDKILERLY